ncbi:tRNA (adenosine(37)-N6)-threonylcarbamoyltransferase complex dimerization subunit type 1 TsaB [Staphylococcus edaphicus]|uniref:tRNA (Adenosine(37)-N6)-threonylcarbamoyltransferase complex dimerization subunit type 1 TsaB n=1 Tax=Staphylococcus edaphicus TaxID=1955013 RepID=A0A2C6WMK8_9STAP|nr:tRNA (adenosine(37)-N6)-threonylcarbamoyltransferase complex dimerization subunit type 1 TsaB [Staphylococcus edaphicus]PHK48677.1 tRNA (adenosine(37)-N6)-threonylcarbamoyltransferase complex dimerization subunit type 1 TsaB [Staphylococcus edaphicus]UQW82347.1 tRNA (adenosine(37)-N6)-threonylcarbamoyltransferase complex dimerization subunit type 1 TsaB [Staphylococcus edaphicus]
MNYLLIDTSNQPLSVAVMQDDKVLSEYNTNEKKNHSIQLMPAISKIIDESQINKSELDAIVVAQGPGSYTGLRIGVTVAKTLAYALNTKLYGVSSLKALAATVKEENILIVPVFDARREAVYTGIYMNQNGYLIQMIEDQYLTISELIEMLHDYGEPYQFVGPDTERLAELLDSTCKPNLPKAKEMKALIQSPTEVHQFKPNYIKISEAERNWLDQQNKN